MFILVTVMCQLCHVSYIQKIHHRGSDIREFQIVQKCQNISKFDLELRDPKGSQSNGNGILIYSALSKVQMRFTIQLRGEIGVDPGKSEHSRQKA